MVKVEAVQGKDSIKLYFETRDTSDDGIDELDTLYSALMGSRPKLGGYNGSTKFVIEVKNED